MDECGSIPKSQSLENTSIKNKHEEEIQTGTSVNVNISASGGNWTQVDQVEVKDEPLNIKSEENDADEIEDLLSMTVSKDYINCVWSSVPDGDGKNADARKNSVAADVASNNCEKSNCSEELKQIKETEMPAERVRSPIIIRRKRKKRNRAKEKAAKKAFNIPEVSKPSNSKAPVAEVENKKPPKLRRTKEKTVRELVEISPLHHIIPPKPDECSETTYKLFTACKKLVVTRTVPNLNPDIMNNPSIEKTLFVCKACGDRFLLETSFQGHMARTIGKFLYKCPVCDERICFGNRCTFLNHVSSHGFSLKYLSPGDLAILPLENDQSEFSSLFKESSLHLTSCTECSQMVHSLPLHFKGEDSVGAKETVEDFLICELCGYISPSRCAASAHNRYHRGEPSYICPDCGKWCLNSSQLLSHIEIDCFHDMKRTEFKCAMCTEVIQSIDEFFEHLTAEHVRSVYRCGSCEMHVEASLDEFNHHIVTEHSPMPAMNLASAASCAVTECDMCPDAVITSASVEDHASFHTTLRSNMQTVFQCKQCECRFVSKTFIADHIPTCQGSKDSPSKNSIIDIIETDSSELLKSRDLGQGTPSRSPLTSPEHSSSPKNMSLKNSPQMEQAEWSPPNDSVSEEMCEQESKVDTNNIQPLSPVQPSEKRVICKICRKIVSVGIDKSLIKRHFSSEHFDIYMNAIHKEVNGQPTHPSETYEMKSDQEIVDSFLNSFTNKDSVPKFRSKKLKMKKGKSKIIKANATGRYGLKTRKLGPVKTVKKCYKCPFASKDLREFKSHIILHKSNASELQCPECGLCFIVRPPLEKHLIARHSIKNVAKYLSDHGFEDHESEMELSDNEDQLINVESDSEVLQENQCKVCKKIFESAMLLEKHFRVHGGAFLLANLKAKRSTLQ